jgi:predicted nucleic acid-binding protein
VVLLDTSVWIEVFRRGSSFDLETVVDLDDVVTCLPVIQEVLQGFRDERAFRRARESLYAMPIVESPITSAVFDEAIALYRQARQAGVAVRSSVDCLIAACALRHNLPVLHRDRDYDALSEICGREVRSIG